MKTVRLRHKFLFFYLLVCFSFMTALAELEKSLLNYELSYVKILGEGQMRAKCSH